MEPRRFLHLPILILEGVLVVAVFSDIHAGRSFGHPGVGVPFALSLVSGALMQLERRRAALLLTYVAVLTGIAYYTWRWFGSV